MVGNPAEDDELIGESEKPRIDETPESLVNEANGRFGKEGCMLSDEPACKNGYLRKPINWAEGTGLPDVLSNS